MVKILLLGSNGMLGSQFCKVLLANASYDLHAFSHADLDICDAEKLQGVFAAIRPHFVVNCTAYTNVDQCEVSKTLALAVNGVAVGNLAKLCADFEATLIHFSTDYVFDGENEGGYLENAVTKPINVYGESKLLGESLIGQNCKNYYIVRTSWLFGPNGKNFVDTMLGLAKGRSAVDVVVDQVGAPTYTVDLVAAVLGAFVFTENDLNLRPELGIYHCVNSGHCSWNAFARNIFDVAGVKIAVNDVGADHFVRAAKRPAFSILINSKLPPLRSWQDALRHYLEDKLAIAD